MKMKTIKMIMISALATAIVGCGGDDDDFDELGDFDFATSVEISGTAEEASVLSSEVLDNNGVPDNSAITYEWLADGAAIAGANEPSYTLTAAEIGTNITLRVSFTDNGGYSVVATSAAIGEIQPFSARLSELTGSITNTESVTQGTVVIEDLEGEESFQTETDSLTTYGSFTIQADGSWTYTLDTADAAVVAIVEGEPLTDEIEVTAFDGTTANLVITISAGEVIATTQVAEITNTNSAGDDTGEVRYTDFDALTQGKITVSFLKEVSLDNNGTEKDAYITLYGPTGSASEALIDLRIQDDNFLIRGREDISFPFDFAHNQWYDVEISWDVTQTDMITLTIDGQVISGGAFSSGAIADADVTDLAAFFVAGVERVQFRYGDNGTFVPDGSYYVDDFALYSDTDGTQEVFSDDFESYAIDFDLGTGTGTPYAGDTVDAIVSSVDDPDGDAGDDEPVDDTPDDDTPTQVAEITNTNSAGDDTGEVRYTDFDALTQGKITVSFLKEVSLDNNGTEKDAYITLYGPTGSASEALIDLRIQDDNFLIRGREDISFPFDFAHNQWYDVEISWDVAQTDMITLTIDGQVISGGAFSSGAIADDDVTDLAAFFVAGVERVQFRYGDNGTFVPDGSYYVDDFALYSDTDGTQEVFSDDFESYAIDFDLGTGTGTPYASDTVDAVVSVRD